MTQQLLPSGIVLADAARRGTGGSVPAQPLAWGEEQRPRADAQASVVLAEVSPGASWQVAFNRQTFFGSQTNYMSHVDISSCSHKFV